MQGGSRRPCRHGGGETVTVTVLVRVTVGPRTGTPGAVTVTPGAIRIAVCVDRAVCTTVDVGPGLITVLRVVVECFGHKRYKAMTEPTRSMIAA
jgi:hypothetical protein